MINNLIDAISIKLNEVFGDNVRIYSESVEQGFTEPCFFINVLGPSNKRKINVTFHRKHPFCIQYFPSTESKSECYEVLETLYVLLEQVSILIDASVFVFRGSKMHGEVIEGVLHFFVNFDKYIKQVKESVNMEEMDVQTLTKG